MQNSKDYLKNHNVVPFISFKESPKHKVKLLSDEIGKIKDKQGVEVDGVHYSVEEAGTEKKFFTSSIGLIQRLAECEADETVTIEMKSKKGEKGWQSYFVVTRHDLGEAEEVPPVIEYEQ